MKWISKTSMEELKMTLILKICTKWKMLINLNQLNQEFLLKEQWRNKKLMRKWSKQMKKRLEENTLKECMRCKDKNMPCNKKEMKRLQPKWCRINMLIIKLNNKMFDQARNIHQLISRYNNKHMELKTKKLEKKHQDSHKEMLKLCKKEQDKNKLHNITNKWKLRLKDHLYTNSNLKCNMIQSELTHQELQIVTTLFITIAIIMDKWEHITLNNWMEITISKWKIIAKIQMSMVGDKQELMERE